MISTDDSESRAGFSILRSKVLVVKRNGSREPFTLDKIVGSLAKIFKELGLNLSQAEELVMRVLQDLEKYCDEKKCSEIPSTMISDTIEKHLMNMGVSNSIMFEIAKRYALGRIYQDVYGKKWDGSYNPRDLRLTFQAIKVLESRYLLKDPETLRYTETPQMLFRRVAKAIAEVERKYGKDEAFIRELEEKFYDLISSLRFMPNSPTLMNAGTGSGLLSACFVIPVRDSMVTPEGEGIMDALRAQALIQKYGGGTGFSFSELRPEGDVVASTSGVASGPLSFMKLFDVNTEVIKQGGKRRGANMGILHVWHPDIERFILSKSGELKDIQLQNFNISVGIYDSFMKALEKGEKFPLINPRKTQLRPGSGDSRYYALTRARYSIEEEWVQEYILKELEENGGSISLDESRIVTWEEAVAIAENEKAIVKWIDPQDLWSKIVKGAWDSGDPGLIFIDTINRRHTAWYIDKINATNPCAEEPLLDWEPCNLGSIDIASYVVLEGDKAYIDAERLAEDIKIMVRFLDNVIDAAKWPLKQLEESSKRTRKIGLGVMGWAYALIKLGIRYDSPDAVYLSWHMARFLYYHALKTSIELAKEKGAFPAYDPNLYNPAWNFSKDLEELFKIAGLEPKISARAVEIAKALQVDPRELDEELRMYGVRNAQVLSIAPTGTISIIAGTSPSIEPIFALAFVRSVAVGTFIEIDRLFLEYLRRYELDDPEVVEAIAETGSIGHNPFMPRTLREVFRTAHDVDPIYHLLHQAAWQQWVDAGVSKTINMVSEATVEDIDKIYRLSWRLGIKGTTVYRDKSKSQQVIYFGLKSFRERSGGGSQSQESRGREVEREEKRSSLERHVRKPARRYVEEEEVEEIAEEADVSRKRKTVRSTAKYGRIRISNKEFLYIEGFEDPSCPTCEL
ncbi:MAG: adenosylcobalamin-dependent ribonucleoside-diphosphate reductase [Sulfolobales archaeon]